MTIRFKGADGESTPPSAMAAQGQPHQSWRGALLPDLPRKISKNYSRFVRTMKWGLPVLALVLIGLVVFWPQLTTIDKSFRLDFTDIDLSVTEKPSMLNVRYVGTDRQDRPFAVTADLARNLDTAGAEVALENPKADILMQDGTWLLLSSKSGLFKRDLKKLELSKRVNLFHDSGYEFHTEHAVIDLAHSAAEGNKPVRVQGAFGDLSAVGFKISDQGRTLFFAGPAHMVLYPTGGESGGGKKK